MGDQTSRWRCKKDRQTALGPCGPGDMPVRRICSSLNSPENPKPGTHLRLHGGEVVEFPILNLENDRALDGVAEILKIHLAGDPFEFLNGGQGVPHLFPVQGAGLGDGGAQQQAAVVGESRHVIGFFAVFCFIVLDEFLGLGGGDIRGVMGAEKGALQVLGPQAQEFLAAPGIGADNRGR